ncbi:hypothetical protein TOPH_00208 [Tolypocladium ophioglossoides CBS 100239]|uniref:Uncharacterized protein n=1 Tax=Tolypocladium ophioglossoides (strain CBS 100239) TaxID=1163406 RepID=A0A0L0NLW0_TOLOC|nr:hypothetical protein TOPH_00208 [Tolypocladium ophioglossoides CBS 100239]
MALAIRNGLSRGRDGSQDGSGPAVPYRPQPSSPTLTNPDMILPDYDDSESLDGRSQSPLLMWKSNTQNANADFHSFPPNTFHSAPLGPTTPIIYGNGTMLSDIGEVTEVESTVGSQPRHTPSHLSRMGGDGTPLRSSPTMGRKVLKKRTTQNGARERRLSIESTSTINELERAAPFGDFDDSVSVDDSDFQGDDEESMAESYLEDTSVVKPSLSAKPSGQGLSEDKFSTNSISKRAEQILANAKRRLTTMEGNLNRARTLSYSPVSDGSTSSPLARPATAMRDNTPPMSTHARNVSETGLQGGSRPTAQLQRSASALGAAGGYRQPLPQSRSVDALGSRYSHSANKMSHHPLDMTLAPLSEDGDDTYIHDNSKRDSSQFSVLASPTFGTCSDAGLTRSSSVAQVRDLQDQMQGLKGKISSLKEQARADSMKRRSLQSLRTPSPFTHARWDQAFGEPPAINTPEIASPPLASPPLASSSSWNGTVPGFETSSYVDAAKAETQIIIEEDAQSVASGYHEARETQDEDPKVEVVEEPEEDDEELDESCRDGEDDISTEDRDGDLNGDGDDDTSIADNRSEGGDSLYHDTYQHPVSHEDREDAFDYEHFFLHSAMGTISRQGKGRGDSSGSEDSDESVETTRGPILSRARRPSLDTFTTIDSFATATEGRASRNSVTHGGRIEDGFVTPSQDYAEAMKRSAFEGGSGSGSGSDERNRFQENRPRQNSVFHRPISTSTTSTLHRPSVSSFESTGTNRSFPLVNRVRLSGGILTPGGSPEHDLKLVSESLMNETASICDKESINGGPRSPAIQTLSREDQMMVERVVASLGRCVLRLTEASRTNRGGQDEFRQRIDAARKMLEGGE